MIRSFRYWIFPISLLCLLISSFNSTGEIKQDEFVSDGFAKVQDSNQLQAKYKALESAKLNAVMQALCSIFPTKQFIDDYPVLKEMVLFDIKKYVSK